MNREQIISFLKEDIEELKKCIEKFGTTSSNVESREYALKGYIAGIYHAGVISEEQFEGYNRMIRTLVYGDRAE